MLTVKDKGNIEALADIKDFKIYQEVNGEYFTSFTSFISERNKYSYPLLQSESVVEFEGHEFRIKDIVTYPNKKVVTALHIYFDLFDHQVYESIGGTKRLDEFLSFILDSTGWTFDVVESIPQQMMTNFGQSNSLSLIKQLCDTFDCEVKIEPNKHLKFYKQIGEDNDAQFRYKHNIKVISESRDTNNLATVIKGYGNNGLEVTYTSPNYEIFGEKHADPFRDERYSIPESLTEALKQLIKDEPYITIEIETAYIGDVNLGDKVWVIHEPIGFDYQSRVMAIERYPYSPSKNKVVLSNKVKSKLYDTLTEVNVKIDENKKETKTLIDQTNERILLQAETFEESIGKIEVRSDELDLSVEQLDKSVAAVNIKADNINLGVQSLDDRVSDAESSINIQAGQISNKVSQTDFNGNRITSLINQDAFGVTINASKINLIGITNVSQTLQMGANNYDGTYKSIVFNGEARISSNSGSQLTLSSQYMDINNVRTTFYGTVDFSGASVTGIGSSVARFG
ncbi:phage tail protein [Bacillus infantis]|uniref:phage tail protein n=1 Tax=Bacillus infantis TaxID=324767 RepID=UPI003CEA7C91